MWEQGLVLAILLGIVTCLLVTRIKPSFILPARRLWRLCPA